MIEINGSNDAIEGLIRDTDKVLLIPPLLPLLLLYCYRCSYCYCNYVVVVALSTIVVILRYDFSYYELYSDYYDGDVGVIVVVSKL